MFATLLFRVNPFARTHRRCRAFFAWGARLAAAFCVLVLVQGSPSRAETHKVFVFGNSLINHASDTDKTTVPYWLSVLAKNRGKDFQLDGQFGFLRNFAEDRPNAQWGFSNVSSAWTRMFRTFEDVGYSHIMINPANFIQYRPANLPYEGENPTGASPLSAASDLLQKVALQKQVILYEGWADLAAFSSRFPPRARPLRKYHAYNIGEYHDWYVDFAKDLQAAVPDAQVTLVPVARILSRAFSETELSQLEATDIYLDDAPHGTPNLYFLAAIPVYAQLFGELPEVADVPADLHPLIKAHFADYLNIISEEMPLQEASATPTKTLPSAAETDAAEAMVVEAQPANGLPEPALGYGLDGVADWSTQVPFIDLMKSSRRWVGHLPGQWGGWGIPELQAGGHLDPHGWPVRIPEEITKLETFMLTDFPEEATLHSGIYRLTYEGEGRLELAGRSRALRYGDKEIWFRFSPGDGALGIALYETDPNGTGDYIRNISIVREDQIPLFEAGVVFNPEWLRVVEDARLLRFMDWMFTNGSPVKTWEDRPQVADYSYTHRGVPLELMVDLVNQIGADPWFNMPHMADDDYVRRFADYVHANLRPGLKAHLEYSNEVWNFLFEQSHWAIAQAEALWGKTPESEGAWMQYYGHRAAQMSAIWSEVFADDMDRLERVFATHTGWPGLEQNALTAPLAVEQGAVAPKTLFDAYAVTGYFGLEYGSDEMAPKVLQWIAESQAAGQGNRAAIEALAADAAQNGFRELTEELWPYHATVAAEHGLDLIMYEGGTHIVGHGEWTNNDELTEFFLELNYSPEMAGLYEKLLSSWHAAGGTVFNAFVEVAKPSKWGSWGARRHLGDSNPRVDVLTAYNQPGATWSNARGAEVFRSGVIVRGGDGADILSGSDHSDVLLGGAGDDELAPGLGKNHLHGGEGNDHAILPGFLEEYRFHGEGRRLVASSRNSTTRLFSVETLSFSETPDLILATSDLF